MPRLIVSTRFHVNPNATFFMTRAIMNATRPLSVDTGGAIDNREGGVIEIQSTDISYRGEDKGLRNAGTIVKTTDAEVTWNTDFDDTGVSIEVREGTVILSLQNDSSFSQTEIQISEGATLTNNGGAFTTQRMGGVNISGGGGYRMDRGNIVVPPGTETTVDLPQGGLQLGGVNLFVDGDFVNQGLATWTGAFIRRNADQSGAFINAATGTVNVVERTAKSIIDAEVRNEGKWVMAGLIP